MACFLLAFGLAFELPLVLTALVVKGSRPPMRSAPVAPRSCSGSGRPRASRRRGADPESPLVIGTAFTVLYFAGSGLIRLVAPTAP